MVCGVQNTHRAVRHLYSQCYLSSYIIFVLSFTKITLQAAHVPAWRHRQARFHLDVSLAYDAKPLFSTLQAYWATLRLELLYTIYEYKYKYIYIYINIYIYIYIAMCAVRRQVRISNGPEACIKSARVRRPRDSRPLMDEDSLSNSTRTAPVTMHFRLRPVTCLKPKVSVDCPSFLRPSIHPVNR